MPTHIKFCFGSQSSKNHQYHKEWSRFPLLENIDASLCFVTFIFSLGEAGQSSSIFQCLAAALLANPSCSDLCRSLALICWLLMLLSPLICTTFGKALIATETEILMDSEGITNGEIVGRRDRKLVFLEDSVSSVSLRMLLRINKC